MKKNIKLIIVENSGMQRKFIKKIFEDISRNSTSVHFEIADVKTLADVQEYKKEFELDIILSALELKDAQGIETVTKIKAFAPNIALVVLTGTENEQLGMDAIQAGAQDYLSKSAVNEIILKRTMIYALERAQMLSVVKKQKDKMEMLSNKLSKYLSPQVYDSIFTGEKDVKIGTTRKKLTIFFSDIVGFTTTSENMKQDELVKWLNDYLNEMANIALKYGGTVDKFIGDAVMVFFGDPETKGEEKDAINCVNMAKEMVLAAKKLDVGIRIGINTGFCTVGNFGSESRMDYTIIGPPVNLSARLESNSEHNRIQISDTTYHLVKDKIDCELRGSIRVKGIDRDIETYWAN